MVQKTRGKRRCKAKSTGSGKQCRRNPINGGEVCYMHGGAAPQVKRKAEERIREYVEKMVDPDRLLREAARLAFADLTQCYDDQGNFKPMKDWPEEIRAAAKGIETVRRNIDHADGQTDQVLKLVAHDKLKALEMLFKNRGLLEDKTTIDGKLEIAWKS